LIVEGISHIISPSHKIQSTKPSFVVVEEREGEEEGEEEEERRKGN
jgi:hypothetical protein